MHDDDSLRPNLIDLSGAEDDEITMGRGEGNTVRVSHDQHGDAVSRRHLDIRRRGVVFHVRARNTTNGTYLNNQLLTPNAWRRLRGNDVLTLGGARMLGRNTPNPFRYTFHRFPTTIMQLIRARYAAPRSRTADELTTRNLRDLLERGNGMLRNLPAGAFGGDEVAQTVRKLREGAVEASLCKNEALARQLRETVEALRRRVDAEDGDEAPAKRARGEPVATSLYPAEDDDASACDICYQVSVNPVKVAECGHGGCQECMTLWMIEQRHGCPMCRAEPANLAEALKPDARKSEHVRASALPKLSFEERAYYEAKKAVFERRADARRRALSDA